MRLPVQQSPLSGIGRSVSDLAKMFFMSQGSPLEREYMQSNIDYRNLQGDKLRAEMAAPGRLAGVFGAVPEGTDPNAAYQQRMADVVGALGQAGQYGQIGQTLLALGANLGLNDDALTGAYVGAGGKLGENDALSIGRQNTIRGENFGQERGLEGMRQSGAMARTQASNAAAMARQQAANEAAMQRLQWEAANAPLTAGAGQTIFTAPGDARGPQLSGMDTESTATGRLIGQLMGGTDLSPEALALVGAMDKQHFPGNPISETQARGGAFQELPPEVQAMAVGPTATEVQGGLIADNFNNLLDLNPYQRQVLGANPSSSAATPRNYVTADGRSGVTLDGVTDAATGAPLPPGSNVFTGQLQADDASGLRPSVITDMQRGEIALGDFNTTVDTLRDVAGQDESLFGVTGNIRRLAQGVGGQASALGQMLGAESFGRVAQDLARAGVSPEYFDPNLNDVERLATLAAYQGASALAGQEGRGLSDKDFEMMRRTIGDPTAWLSTRESFLSGLDRVQALANQMAENRRRALGGGSTAVPPAAAPVQAEDPLGIR